MSRDRVVCMMRIRNEGRWIYRSLERTFQVAGTAVLWDDGSTDNTFSEALRVYHEGCRGRESSAHMGIGDTWGSQYMWEGEHGKSSLLFVNSPFRMKRPARPKMAVSEIRDKQALWEIVKARLDFDHVLCLDGDEVLSREAVHHFPQAIKLLEDRDHDILTLPILYLWDSENTYRDDGIYGVAADGIRVFRVPRLFTIKRVSEQNLFDMRFAWEGDRGGFHGGSVPRQAFKRSGGEDPHGGTFPFVIAHYGYIDEDLRQRKYRFYNEIDPGNVREGEYKHIVGIPDLHAPGPMTFQSWSDEIRQREWVI